jgi:hypothetical protein
MHPAEGALLRNRRLLAPKIGRPFARRFDGRDKLLARALRVTVYTG